MLSGDAENLGGRVVMRPEWRMVRPEIDTDLRRLSTAPSGSCASPQFPPRFVALSRRIEGPSWGGPPASRRDDPVPPRCRESAPDGCQWWSHAQHYSWFCQTSRQTGVLGPNATHSTSDIGSLAPHVQNFTLTVFLPSLPRCHNREIINESSGEKTMLMLDRGFQERPPEHVRSARNACG
jgi:hypothetical protein